ncbi:MAG: AGE family epimerase/isomerase [Bdellovibrionaceae bacterium]|nr:AGE family epimerase/isomerase [Pseudobdellovibrionaceae bacterium]
MIQKSQQWLKDDVFPLWLDRGVDRQNGGFIESLSFFGQPSDVPRRAMVQARQIYSFVTAAKLKSCDSTTALETALEAARTFQKNYLLESGACLHATHANGQPQNTSHELYTQAFALFALANAYGISKDGSFKNSALKLLAYLERERVAPAGGYTEIKDGKTLYQSNPHMHLFEAALAWIAVDPTEKSWQELAQKLFTLCTTKFIQPETGTLAEHFTADWKPELHAGRFLLEPGHHFEWAWLLSVDQDLGGPDSHKIRHRLRDIGERGVDANTHLAYDEIWNDLSPKKKSSRFWPHCERIKAAVKLGLEVPADQQAAFALSADQALEALFGYFQTSVKGLWQDARQEDGSFTKQDPKASSLYHIINAMDEYVNLRPKLNDSVEK